MKNIRRDDLLLGVGRTWFIMRLAKANIEGLTLGLSKRDQVSILGVAVEMILLMAQELGFSLEEVTNSFNAAQAWVNSSPAAVSWSPMKFFKEAAQRAA